MLPGLGRGPEIGAVLIHSYPIRNRIARRRSLFQCNVIVADDASNLPGAILPLPYVNELRLPSRFAAFRGLKAMASYLDRSVAVHGIHLQSTGNEFSSDFPADILFDLFRYRLAAHGKSTLIVIKLQ